MCRDWRKPVPVDPLLVEPLEIVTPRHAEEACHANLASLAGRCLLSTSSPCTSCPGSTLPTRRCSRTSRSASCPGPRSACSAPTARASPRCCGSWPGRTPTFAATPSSRPGATVGLLEQEPQLDPDKDVKGNVEDGVRELRDMLDRFNELAANYSDETAGEFARLQDAIDAADAWNLDTTLEIAMDALRLPPPRRGRRDPERRRAPPRGPLPPVAERARPAAARRAHQPPRRRVGGLAREAPRGLQGAPSWR